MSDNKNPIADLLVQTTFDEMKSKISQRKCFLVIHSILYYSIWLIALAASGISLGSYYVTQNIDTVDPETAKKSITLLKILAIFLVIIPIIREILDQCMRRMENNINILTNYINKYAKDNKIGIELMPMFILSNAVPGKSNNNNNQTIGKTINAEISETGNVIENAEAETERKINETVNNTKQHIRQGKETVQKAIETAQNMARNLETSAQTEFKEAKRSANKKKSDITQTVQSSLNQTKNTMAAKASRIVDAAGKAVSSVEQVEIDISDDNEKSRSASSSHNKKKKYRSKSIDPNNNRKTKLRDLMDNN